MRALRKKGMVAAALLVCLLPVASVGCFGRFALTRKVYRFNRDLSHDRWVRWFGFLVMVIVPVYGAAGTIDLVFANSIEFWGGQNPFAAGERETLYAIGPQGERLVARPLQGGAIELRVEDSQGAIRRLRVVRESAALAAYDEQGALVARVGDVDGAAAVLDPEPPDPVRSR